MRKIIAFLLLSIVALLPINNINAEEVSSYKYRDLKDLKKAYKTYRTGFIKDYKTNDTISIEVRNRDIFKESYYDSAKFYISKARFLGSFRPLQKENKSYLTNWINLKNINKKITSEGKFDRIVAKQELDHFYEEVFVNYNGQIEWLPIQKIISQEIKKDVLSGTKEDIYINALVIGRKKNNNPIIIITGYTIPSELEKEEKEREEIETTYNEVKEFLSKGGVINIQKGLRKLKSLEREYPQNKNIKTDICLITSMLKNNEDTLNCYNKLIEEHKIRNFESYYGLGKAQYYSNITKDENLYRTAVITLSKAVNFLHHSKNQQGLYNALYLRALAKIEIKDKTAIGDLKRVNANRPDLVSINVINNIKKQLGVK